MSTFDPLTGKVIDPEDLRSKQFSGKRTQPRSKIVDGKKVTEILRDDDGTLAATTTEHPSGRIDGNAFPQAPVSGADADI